MYRTSLDGLTTDFRGVPLGQIPVTLSNSIINLETGPDGTFQALTNEQQYGYLSAAAPGYGTLPTTELILEHDAAHKLVLPPQPNWVANGEFEAAGSQLENWDVSGPGPVQASAAHSGSSGVRIGRQFQFPEMTSLIPLAKTNTDNVEFYIDPNDGLHEFINLEYFYKPKGANWSASKLLYPSGFRLFPLASNFDANGTLHIAFEMWKSVDDTDHCIFVYLKKTSTGIWSSPETQNRDCYYHAYPIKDLYATPQGEVKVVFSFNGLKVMQRNSAGVWSSPYDVNPNIPTHGGGYPDAKYDFNAVLHTTFLKSGPLGTGSHIIYQTVLPDGSVSPEFDVASYMGPPYLLEVGPDDKIHLAWENGYIYKDPGGSWSDIKPTSISCDSIGVSGNGKVLIAYGKQIAIKLSDHVNFGTYKDMPTGFYKVALSTDGRIHALSMEESPIGGQMLWIYALSSVSPTVDEITSVSQSITIPTGAHQPTMSLFYKTYGFGSSSNSGFSVRVSPSTEVGGDFPQPLSQEWKHAWVDLSPWVGQTVTLSIEFLQKAGEFPGTIWVDEVSAGEWLTPYPQALSRSKINWPIVEPVQNVLLGENFIQSSDGEPPTVRLNGIPVSVEWIDENSLGITIPTDFPPGTYTVEVTNPNGYKASLKSGLSILMRVFLPLARR